MSSYPSSTIRVLAHTREDMVAVALPPSRSANQHRSELPEGLVSFALIPPSFGINYWYLPAKYRGTEHQAASEWRQAGQQAGQQASCVFAFLLTALRRRRQDHKWESVVFAGGFLCLFSCVAAWIC